MKNDRIENKKEVFTDLIFSRYFELFIFFETTFHSRISSLPPIRQEFAPLSCRSDRDIARRALITNINRLGLFWSIPFPADWASPQRSIANWLAVRYPLDTPALISR